MKTVFRVFSYLKRYPLLATAQLTCAVLMTLLVVVFPSVAQTITGEVIPQRDFDRLIPLALLAVGTFFATNLFNSLRIILNNTFEQKVIFDIRSDLYRKIQRLPMLLNEVHRIYESGRGIQFALSGSSARKLRREGANLLAGRALQEWMFPFLYPEYAPGWTIAEACEWGTLPLVVSDPQHRARTLAAYVEMYIREEIRAEALVRNLDPFVRVLQIAGLYNAQILNIENLARESGVKRSTVERYFQILEDTLLATRVPAIKLGIRTRETLHPKFFLFDTGVARAAAGLMVDSPDEVWKGFAFEALIHHELIAIEVKSGDRFKPAWTSGLKTLLEECPESVRRGIVVYQGTDHLVIDGIDILPAAMFLERLHADRLLVAAE